MELDAPNIPWAAVGPMLALGFAFVAYCLIDIFRSEVKVFPRWVWALVTVLSIPLGGVAYLIFGRVGRAGGGEGL